MARLSRRGFFGVLGMIGVGATAAGCGEEAATRSNAEEQQESPNTFSCMDTTGLTPAEVQLRVTLEYTDQSAVAGSRCDNCALYVPPESAARCGTCLTVKGPIHAAGWCAIWAMRTG